MAKIGISYKTTHDVTSYIQNSTIRNIVISFLRRYPFVCKFIQNVIPFTERMIVKFLDEIIDYCNSS